MFRTSEITKGKAVYFTANKCTSVDWSDRRKCETECEWNQRTVHESGHGRNRNTRRIAELEESTLGF